MSTVTSTTSLIGFLFSELTTLSSSNPDYWSTATENEAISLINGSSLLVSQILDLSNDGQGWLVIPVPGEPESAETIVDDHEIVDGEIQGGTQTGVNNAGLNLLQAESFVSSLAYEIGHAEDPQANTIVFGDSDLEFAANFIEDFLSEGKSETNSVIVQQQILMSDHITIPFSWSEAPVAGNITTGPNGALVAGSGAVIAGAETSTSG
jgi:hypothetical protein